jgi:hypothetical protein
MYFTIQGKRMGSNPGYAIVFVFGLAVLNVVGLAFANYFGTLVFLDTLATAMAGLSCFPFGVFSGAIVGLATNLLISRQHRAYLKFLHVNAACGIAWTAIAKLLPLNQLKSENKIVLYTLGFGLLVGLLSAVLSVPVRLILGFQTEHLLDQVSRDAWKQATGKDQISRDTWRTAAGLRGIARIFALECVLSHLLDKTISTTVGVMYLIGPSSAPATRSDIGLPYHDMIEFLAACYYVAMGYAIKSLKVKFKQDDEVFALLGPLGFFAVLIVLPVLMRALGIM